MPHVGVFVGVTSVGALRFAGALSAALPVTLTGLTAGVAEIGDEATISADLTSIPATAMVSEAWGTSYGNTTFGTGSTPTSLAAASGGFLFYEGVGDDSETYVALVPVRYPAPVLAAPSNQLFANNGGNQTYDISGLVTFGGTPAYSIPAPIAGVSINSSGVITFDTDALAIQSATSITFRVADSVDATRYDEESFTFTIADSASLSGLTDNPTYGNTAQHGVELTASLAGASTWQWQERDDPGDATPANITGATSATFTPNIGTNITDTYQIRAVPDGDPDLASPWYTVRYAPPTLSGAAIGQQNLFKNVALGANLDITGLFSGLNLTYGVNLLSGSDLPDGLTLNAAGGFVPSADKPSFKTNPAELPTVYFSASNSGGSVTDDDGVTFAVTGPTLSITNVVSNNVTASTNDPDSTGTIAWAFCSSIPAEADLAAGVGTGILIAGSYAADAAGDDLDLTAEVGTAGFFCMIQIGGAGSAYANGVWSNMVVEPLTVQAVAPLAFEAADWAVATGAGSGELDVTINALPEDGGDAIDDIEFRVNVAGAGYGAWTTSLGTTSFTIGGVTPGASTAVQIRAVNAAGEGATSTTEKTATAGGAGGLTEPVKLAEVTSSADSTNPELAFTPSGNGVLVVKVAAMNGASATAEMTVTSADIGTAGRADGSGTDAANSVTRHNGRNNSQIYVFPNPGSSAITFEMVTGSLRAHHIEAWEYPGDQAAQAGASDTEAASTGTSQAYSIPTPPAGGFLACMSCMRFENDDTFRWTGVTEQYPEWDPGVNELPPTETNAGGSNTNDLSCRSAWKDYGSDDPVTAGVAWTTSATHAGVCIVIEPA